MFSPLEGEAIETAKGRLPKFEDLEPMAATPSKAVVPDAFWQQRLYGENDPLRNSRPVRNAEAAANPKRLHSRVRSLFVERYCVAAVFRKRNPMTTMRRRR
jgi:hypothetical protein